MGRVHDDMRDVELVEEVDARHDDDPVGTGERRRGVASSWSAAARRRARTAAVVVAAGALVVGAGGAVLTDRREAARLRALADVPGVLAPLDGPVQELWTTDGWPTTPMEDVDGRLVTVLSKPGTTLDAVALDPLTGRARWRTTVGPSASGDVPNECVVTGPELSGSRAHPILACVIADELATTSDAGRPTYPYPVRARLVVVDAVTGEHLGDRPVDPPVSIAPVRSDIVLGTVDDLGRARVARVDPRTGTERWVFTGPAAVPDDELGRPQVWIQAEGDLVLVGADAVRVLSGDGEVLRELTGSSARFASVQVLPGGRTLAHHRERADALRTDLVDVATGRSTTVPGYVVVPHPDDGSLPGTLLVASPDAGGLVAHDSTTGRVRWRVVGHDSSQPMVLDGRVVTVDGETLEALDGATGAVVWSARVPGVSASPVLTDGRLVLVTVAAATDSALLALDLDDGRQVWTTTLDDQPYLFSHGGRLLGYGSRGVVALGDRG